MEGCEIDPATIALIGTLFGGVGLQFTGHLLGRRKSRDDLATQLRGELKGEIATLRQELRQVENEVDVWREKYYTLLDQFIKVKLELERSIGNATERNQQGNLGVCPE
ncbi:membrane protein [Satellite phage MiniFlayer]|nr:membrane protein [Satellite phage MiniFlayer]